MSYYEDLVAYLMEKAKYPYGKTTTMEVNGENISAPIGARTLSSNEERGTRMQASQAEDAMLNYQLGSKRKLGKGEHKPEGSYTEAWYPGLDFDIWAAGRGMQGRGAGSGAAIIPGSEEDKKLREARRQWAMNQARMFNGTGLLSGMGRF